MDEAPARAAPSAEPAAAAPARIAALDGLRGLSILLVLVGHASGTAGAPPLLAHVQHAGGFDVANVGVRVFFVISGWLITTLLVSEGARTGRIDLPRFYLRRAVRLMPGYVALVLAMTLAAAAGAVTLRGADLLHAATYTTNYQADPSWALGHLWSLAVEEQFYLLWPLALAWLGVRRAAWVALAAVALAPVARAIGAAHDAETWRVALRFETNVDALALGCLLALASARRAARPHAIRVGRAWWAVSPALVAAAWALGPRTPLGFAVGTSLVNGAIALVVWRALGGGRAAAEAPAATGLARAFGLRPLAWLGTVSYSVYLWQQPFLNREAPAALTAWPQNLLLALAAALAGYHLIERPALARRTAIERRLLHSSARP